MNNQVITYFDWLLAPFYILLIYVVAVHIKNRHIKTNPIYKYFLWGLFAKIGGAICVCLVYVYYYKQEGDTMMYNQDSSTMLRLLWKSPQDFLVMWLSPLTKETASFFDSETGYLHYNNDPNSFMVNRLIVILKLISFDSYLVSSILMAVLSYTGIWKLYLVFCSYYPILYRQFALTILFVPSVFFWGSGLLKDSWTLAGVCWFTYSLYMIVIRRRKNVLFLFELVVSCFIVISIKPYIFVAILPASLLWMVGINIHKIRNQFLKFLAAPVVLVLGVIAGYFIWLFTNSYLGEYATIDSILKTAVEKSEDLKQEYYQGNSFDLGKFDPTISGILIKFPIATLTGLFRPFLWEAKNVVMVLSGIENTIILLFGLYILLLRNPVTFLSNIFSNPLVLFCLVFAIFFSFSVALSTSNFGALVRLRIPQIPFLLSALMILYFENNPYRKQK